jgi:hypothetical protein
VNLKPLDDDGDNGVVDDDGLVAVAAIAFQHYTNTL